MKKIMIIICLIMGIFLLQSKRIYADELEDSEAVSDEVLTDTVIVDFDYYPSASLSGKSIINIVWKTKAPMENLVIKTYSTIKGEYVKSFDMEWNLDDLENEYDVVFKLLSEPYDNPGTDIDETEGELWCYNVKFRVDSSQLGLLNIVFEYWAKNEKYENVFYIPNVVGKQVSVTGKVEKNVITTKNAIKVSILASIAGVLGTFAIIWSTKIKKVDDDEEIGGKK